MSNLSVRKNADLMLRSNGSLPPSLLGGRAAMMRSVFEKVDLNELLKIIL
jgi:hypothetical protein